MKNKTFYIHSFIGMFIVFGSWMLPAIEPMTLDGTHMLGVFVGMIYMWTFVGSLWPSLLGIVAVALSGYMPVGTAVAKSFADTNALVVFFSMILFGGIEASGVAQYVAQWFLTRRIINGRPLIFTGMFLFGTYLLASLIGPIPGLLFMWPIAYSILKETGYKAGDKYATILVIGTFISSVLGQGTVPFKSSPLVILGAYETVNGSSIPYFQYIIFAVITAVVAIWGYVVLVQAIVKPDLSRIRNVSTEDFEKNALPPMNLVQKIYFAVLWLYMLVLLVPNMLPKTWPVVAQLNRIGVIGVTLLFIVGLCLIRVEEKNVLDFKQIAGRYVNWNVYFLVASAQLIAGILSNPETGFRDFILVLLDPLFGGKSVLAFSVVLIIFSILITNVAANAVMGILLMPVVAAFSANLGANAAALSVIVTLSLHVAMLTPAASPVAAILHGNKEWVQTKDIYMHCGIVVLLSMVTYMIIGIPLANMMF